MDRLTISKGELKFYALVDTKCSNRNLPEIEEQVKKGIPFYDIKGYQSTSYNEAQLSNMYSKLSRLEDILEKYGIESVEELEEKMRDLQFQENMKILAVQQRDAWKKACELAVETLQIMDGCPYDANHYYQQAQKEMKE